MSSENTDSKQKDFDAVEFMRKRRYELSQEIQNMSAEDEIKYFRKKVAEIKKNI